MVPVVSVFVFFLDYLFSPFLFPCGRGPSSSLPGTRQQERRLLMSLVSAIGLENSVLVPNLSGPKNPVWYQDSSSCSLPGLAQGSRLRCVGQLLPSTTPKLPARTPRAPHSSLQNLFHGPDVKKSSTWWSPRCQSRSHLFPALFNLRSSSGSDPALCPST